MSESLLTEDSLDIISPLMLSNSMMRLTLTVKQFVYIKDCLDNVYQRRIYMRNYMREERKVNKGEGNFTAPAVLFHLESSSLTPAPDHEDIQAALIEGLVQVDLNMRQILYVEEILRRHYVKRQKQLQKNKTKDKASKRTLVLLQM